MDILLMSGEEQAAAHQYLQDRKIPELFQSLTVGLLQHRPENPRQYLLECLDLVHRTGWQNVFWDTFLPRERCHSGLSPIARPADELGKAEPESTEATGGESRPTGEMLKKQVNVEDIEVALKNEAKLVVRTSRPKLMSSEAQMSLVSEDAQNAQAGYDVTMLKVMEGSMEDLPAMPSNTVRIFLSSTFSDFKAERNILPRKAYPELSAFCRERGLDFQVVDMRWGVTDDVINDHQVSELCIKEIAMCQQVSCGPNFVTLVGNRYGFRPFPAKIESSEFELLASIAKATDEKTYTLLTEWFLKDENAVPAAYILQPIHSRLQHYNDISPENQAKRAEDRSRWTKLFSQLRETLEKAAKEALKEGKLKEAEAEKYYISVTEHEIHCGLQQSGDINYRALCYMRNLEGIQKTETAGKWLSRFIDLTPEGQLDKTAMNMCKALRENKIPGKLHETRRRSYESLWTGMPLESSAHEKHLAYLENFCRDFVADMKDLVSRNLLNSAVSKRKEAEVLYREVLHHAKFARHKCEIFCGRDLVLEKIKKYLHEGTKPRNPLVISGKSGYGKTSLLAYVAKCIPQWVPGKSVTVVRFLGTTPLSSNIYSTLRSVIEQICVAYDYSVPDTDMEKMGDVRRCLWGLLEKVGQENPETRLYLLLDSVDQLSETYGGHRMVWLPRVLPRNVSLVVSMLSDRYDCLANTKQRMPKEELYYELEPLSTSTAEQIIAAYMALHNRRLTNDQTKLVTDVFSKCRQPLFLKLVLDAAQAWNSYTPVDSVSIATSVHEAITQLLESLEGQYGQTFVQKSLGYLTCGYGGLTSLELEDVLSCDDEVLVEVYQYHDPPLEGTIRLPSLMWSRLQHALREYLAERQVLGKTVLTWYHRQFWEAAEERYLGAASQKIALHRTLAELFAQEHGVKRTIVLTQRAGKVLEDADRRVALQPLNVNNVRKLGSLPYHLLNSGQIEELKSRCLVNFKWMLTKLRAVGVADLFREYGQVLTDSRLEGSENVTLMRNFTELCHDALGFDPELLAFHAIEWLANLKRDGGQDPLIQTFVKDAQIWKDNSREPLMWPTYPMNFPGLDTPLEFSMLVGYDGMLTSDEKVVICSMTERKTNDHTIQCLALDAKDILSTVKIPKMSPVATYKNSFFYLHSQKLILCEIDSGELVHEIYFGDQAYDAVTPRCMRLSENQRYLAFGVKFGKPTEATDDKIWKMTCLIYLVDLEDLSKPTIKNINFPSKKHVDAMWFANEDQHLVCFSRERIIVFNVPSLETLHSVDKVQLIYGPTCQHVAESSLIVGGVKQSQGARILMYWYQDNYFELSNKLNVDDEIENEVVEPFSVESKDDYTRVLIGVMTDMREIHRACLWVWDRDTKVRSTEAEYTKIPIGVKMWKQPSITRVTKDWAYAIVGWRNGDLSIVSLDQRLELLNLDHAHGHTINMAQVISEGKRLVTMASDSCLKMWDLDCLMRDANGAVKKTGEEDGDAGADSSSSSKPQMLDENEQVLEVTVTRDFALTANQWNVDGPRFWDLETGTLLKDLTETHGTLYKESLEANEINTDNRCHANLEIYGDVLLYTRKRRSCSSLYIVKDLKNPRILTHQFIPSMFFHLVPDIGKTVCSDDGKLEVIIARDGSVEVRDLATLDLIKSIEMSKISEELGNIDSQAGKRKLIFMKVALTFDGKYFLVMNPTATKAQGGRYFHMVDLHKGVHYKKCPLISANGNSFHFLVERDGAEFPEIFCPSDMPKLKDGEKFKYKSLVYTRPSDQSFLSKDGTIGFQFTNKFCARLWQVEPLKKLHSLYGHIAGMTGSISLDNRFFATGSYDNTVRVWSVTTGEQLCMFHLYGAISGVMFTPQNSHLVVHCYAAPQRKRAAILEIRNIEEHERSVD